MKESINFSQYDEDLSRFQHDWEEVRRFVTRESLDGIELLIGSGDHPPGIPPGLVTSVHLPGWYGWTRTWGEPASVPKNGDIHETEYYYGAYGPYDLLERFSDNLAYASGLHARYAVLHASHVELEDVFTGACRYSSEEILSRVASCMNALCSRFPGGEPPVPIAFENLWWPGLTFQSDEELQTFSDLLEFDNWFYLLDTGHLMNRILVSSEEEGIARVLSTLEHLSSETRERIRAIHLQCSTSGTYQRTRLRCPPPQGFSTMSYGEKISRLFPHIHGIDEHRPFTDPACAEIIDLVHPEYLVHEFITGSREELEQMIRTQQKTLSGE